MASSLPHRAAPHSKPIYEATERVDIVAWADEAAESLNTVTITPTKSTRGTSVTLSIPLDGHSPPKASPAKEGEEVQAEQKSVYTRRRERLRRDSLKHREALLKGKEGSRRRQRWENDRLLNNPWAQPPLPSDWQVQPTYPRYDQVPYFLAPLWDATETARREEEQKKRARKAKGLSNPEDEEVVIGRVPKDLRDKLKRTKAAKGLLMDLENEVRRFVESWEKQQERKREDGLHDADSDEDEIVFVGRNGVMHDLPPSPKANRTSEENLSVERAKLIFDSAADDRAAGFGRWLVHSIATYYGLNTWSVTKGNPARREAYVGIRPIQAGHGKIATGELPRPLWGMV